MDENTEKMIRIIVSCNGDLEELEAELKKIQNNKEELDR